jgi:hypothetical protein
LWDVFVFQDQMLAVIWLICEVAIGFRVRLVEQTELTRPFTGTLSLGLVARVDLTGWREQSVAQRSRLLQEQVEVRHAVDLLCRLFVLQFTAERSLAP